MAEQIIPARFNPSHEPLQHSLMPPSWQGGKVTNTEAQALVSKLRRWSCQFNHPEANELSTALKDVERCFDSVCTEIDEALTRLMLMKSDPERADEHLQIALEYLHRWQDRGGRMGNAAIHAQ